LFLAYPVIDDSAINLLLFMYSSLVIVPFNHEVKFFRK